jgi:hypothetical protein
MTPGAGATEDVIPFRIGRSLESGDWLLRRLWPPMQGGFLGVSDGVVSLYVA